MFEPPVQALLDRMAGGAGFVLDVTRIGGYRRAMSAAAQDREIAPGVSVADIEVSGVPVRLYRPAGEGPRPLHVYLHGGGFMFGSALSGEYDGILSRRASEAGCVVASVEYRLAPEHKFPAGIEDSYAALMGMIGRAGEFGLDTSAVSIGGVSSGGNFAAAVALMMRDRGGPPLALQLLEIAGTDLTKSSYAWRYPAPGHDTTRERDLVGVDHYLGRLDLRAHPYASPLFAPDLAGVAPAYVMNAEFDPRRDECEAYVARLLDAGVTAVSRCMAGHIHGSYSIKGWPPAEAWQAEANRALASAHEAARAGRAVVF